MLGRFQILDEVGVGGMGLVFKGKDPRINRLVALKVVRPSLGTRSREQQQKATDRFYVEAQAAGQLSHPSIVTIYDVGEEESSDGSMVYIAMEFLDGRGLDWHIQHDTFDTLEKKIEIIRKMAEGLTYAHKRSVIHRDIKPANIIVNNDGEPKITDFGLARLSDSSLTMSGTILGTPNYMSPEQVQGKDVNAKSDFFSLSVVCYEMFTGEKPFAGDSITSVIYKVVNEDPAAPTEINSSLPSTVDVFMKRALAKNPDQRFQAGDEYIKALNSILKSSTKDIDLLGDSTVVGKGSGDGEKAGAAGGLGGIPKGALIGGGVFLLFVIMLSVLLLTGGEEEKPIIVAEKTEEPPTPPPPEEPPEVKPKEPVEETPPVKPKEPEKPDVVASTMGKFSIKSDPKGAEVFINGKSQGMTPIKKLELKKGEHTVKIVKKGYDAYETKITVEKDSNFIVNLAKGEIKKEAPKPKVAKITTTRLIVKVPSNSMIVVDGRQYREKTLTLNSLSEGSHIVYVQLKGKKPYTERFSLKVGKPKVINLR